MVIYVSKYGLLTFLDSCTPILSTFFSYFDVCNTDTIQHGRSFLYYTNLHCMLFQMRAKWLLHDQYSTWLIIDKALAPWKVGKGIDETKGSAVEVWKGLLHQYHHLLHIHTIQSGPPCLQQPTHLLTQVRILWKHLRWLGYSAFIVQ